MSNPIPVKMAAFLATQVDPVTKLPVVSLSFSLATRSEDGTYKGVGNRALVLDAGLSYEEVDPITRLPNGVFITGEKILAALLGLAHASQEV